MTHPATIAGLDPTTLGDLLRVAGSPGFDRPVHIGEFVRDLENDSIGGTYARNIYANVRAVLSAAVDDGSRVLAVRDALPERYRAIVDVGSGCGPRQGEIIGLAGDTLQLDSDTLRVTTQVKLIRGVAVFAPPKGNKERDVPLPCSAASALRQRMEHYPPVTIKLPWARPDGPLTERRLIFTNTADGISGEATSTSRNGSPPSRPPASSRRPNPASRAPPLDSTECTPYATSTPRSSWTRARASRP